MISEGYKLSDQARQNISDGHLGMSFTLEHRKKISLALKGRKLTPETRLLLSDIASKRKLSEETKAKIGDAVRGDKHPNWKGGVTYPIFALRKTKEYRHWRKAVLERDGYQCQKCHKSDSRLDAHHIFSFTLFPELRFEVSNGITVCVRCHTKYKEQLGIKGDLKMPIETFDDILEELADMFGVYGTEIRNDWIIKMRRRIERGIKAEELLSNEKAKASYVLKHMPVIDDPAIHEALADMEE